MSISNNKKKRPSVPSLAPSRVLLTCVYDTIVLEISNQAVFARFSPFGTVTRILIFERGEVTKFFIEFGSTQSAIRAKCALDGTKLYEAICKMNIYFSNFSSVDLKHQTTQGIALEYIPERNENCTFFGGFQGKMGTEQTNRPIFNSYVLLASEDVASFHEYQTFSDNYEEGVLRDLTKDENVIAMELEKSIQNDINLLLRSGKKKPLRQNLENIQIFPQENTSHFLCFFIKQNLSNSKIYNLFSNFGNISYIKQTKNMVYLKYKSQQFAQIAKSYLQGHILSKNKLVFFDLGQPMHSRTNEQQFSENTYYDHSNDRFTTSKSMTINPPSQTLHVSSLKRECCNAESLRSVFQRFGRVEKVEILAKSAEKNMALVKFGSMEESFEAISEMHGRSFGGRRMQISFTKSKVL